MKQETPLPPLTPMVFETPSQQSTLSGYRNRWKPFYSVWTRWFICALVLTLLNDFGFLGDLLYGSDAGGEHKPGGHVDPATPILLGIVLILFLAKVGGDLFERIGMPAVLGELLVGVIIGNFALLSGYHELDFMKPDSDTGHILEILAGIGVVLLLFEVGLESNIKEMFSVGVSSLLVAVLGVVAPMGLGYLSGKMVIPDAGWHVHMFIGATLCATSVGITARVLKDIGRSGDQESKIILGAAVIDDVLGLIVLAVVSGIILQGDHFQVSSLTKIVGFPIAFLAIALILGMFQFPKALFKAASYLRGHGLLVTTALVICFSFAFAANYVGGLAPIIGAFAAGLILENTHYREVGKYEWEDKELEEALAPISALLVPVFFVQMGIKVDLNSFTDSSVWGLAAAITIVAIIGKQVCSFGVLEKGLNKTAVGLGMIPRGEVGLIFAGEGEKLMTADKTPVISAGTYSAVVVMVMITTMVTPPLLKWSMSKPSTAGDSTSEETSSEHA